MSTSHNAVCRRCRVEKTKLFLKGDKCLSSKCPVERRSYAPGQHGRIRRRILGYGIQLREKQKLKRYYGMTEKQFRLFFTRAESQKGVTGENLLGLLERRLDNVVFLAGFAHSRAQARLLIAHGHFQVNERKASVPSYVVGREDVIVFRDQSAKRSGLRDVVDAHKAKTIPGWMEVDRENLTVRIMSLPTRADVTMPVEEHLVVELYSK
ncbi:MAG: 30S ribosomal protein S4 [Candidatus Aminicenantes bacterium]|nr:30S ribosomal protein S4 [Candidatus Aminicenantes bacterium]